MTTRKITSDKELMELVQTANQLTLTQLINGRYHHTKKSWVNFELSSEISQKLAHLVVACYGGKKRTALYQQLASGIYYGNISHWGFDRTFLLVRNNELVFTYCAGQDMPHELNQIRKYIYNR
jgi:hypothetical protein